MKLTLKNYEIVKLYSGITEFMNRKIKLGGKLCYNLTKNLNKLQVILKDVQDCELKLIEDYADRDEDGKIKLSKENNNPLLKTEHVQIYNKEYNELLNFESEVELHKIKLEDIIFTKDEKGNLIERELDSDLLNNIFLIIDDEE